MSSPPQVRAESAEAKPALKSLPRALRTISGVTIEGPGAGRFKKSISRSLSRAGYVISDGKGPVAIGGNVSRKNRTYRIEIVVFEPGAEEALWKKTYSARRLATLEKRVEKDLLKRIRPVIDERNSERVTEIWKAIQESAEPIKEEVVETKTPPKNEDGASGSASKPPMAEGFRTFTTSDVIAELPTGVLKRRQSTALRRKGDIKVDGKDDDPAWQRVPETEGGWQQRPIPGAPLMGKIFFRVTYDDENLYVFVRAEDPEPDKIASQMHRETFDLLARSDWLSFLVDSDLSRQRAFWFMVNPSNIRLDGVMPNDAEFDITLDMVWDSATQITDKGWQVEARVPLSQMNISGGQHSTWGFNIFRRVGRSQELSLWSPWPYQTQRWVSSAGNLEINDTIDKPLSLELTPYLLGGARLRGGIPDTDEINQSSDFEGGIGGDLRVSLGESANLFLAVNPNFGQVEADPSQINLSAQELFFAERRSLFLRGLGQYELPIGGGFERLFYTRRIGAPPKLRPPGAVFSDIPLATTVYGAARLAATIGRHTSVGAISSLTAEERADYQDMMGNVDSAIVEPMTLYNVVQSTTNFNQGNSDLRLLGTHMHRFLPDSINVLHKDAYTGAVRYQQRFAGGDWQFRSMLSGSYVQGPPEALTFTQANNVHNFQRPDAPHLDFDPTRTSMFGTAFMARIEKLGMFKPSLQVHGTSPGYEVNDLGFLLRSDIITTTLGLEYLDFPGTSSWLRAYGLVGGVSMQNDYAPELLRVEGDIVGNLELASTAHLDLGFGVADNVRDTRLLRGGPSVAGEREVSGQFTYYTDRRKAAGAGVSNHWLYRPSSNSYQVNTSLPLRWDVMPQINLSLVPAWTSVLDKTQYVAAVPDAMMETHYVLGTVNQDVLSTTIRLDAIFSPFLRLSVYAQPFMARGEYTEYREVADTETKSFGGRYNELTIVNRSPMGLGLDSNGDMAADLTVPNREFLVTELNATVVLQWQYRLGSYFYLIWNQVHNDLGDDLLLRNNFDKIVSDRAQHVLLAKLSFWFDM